MRKGDASQMLPWWPLVLKHIRAGYGKLRYKRGLIMDFVAFQPKRTGDSVRLEIALG